MITPSGERSVPVAELRAGDLVAVHPGERIAVDGTVAEGASYVDESMLCGEPLPVCKQEGAAVFAGTMNGNGAFRFRTDRVGHINLFAIRFSNYFFALRARMIPPTLPLPKRM